METKWLRIALCALMVPVLAVPASADVSFDLVYAVGDFGIGRRNFDGPVDVVEDREENSYVVDRGNNRIAHLYEPTHPAMLRMLRQVIEEGHRQGLKVGVCGEIAGEPLYVPLLVGMGVDELSVAAASIPRVKEVIRRLNFSETQELAAATLHATRSREVLAMLNALVQRIDPDVVS